MERQPCETKAVFQHPFLAHPLWNAFYSNTASGNETHLSISAWFEAFPIYMDLVLGKKWDTLEAMPIVSLGKVILRGHVSHRSSTSKGDNKDKLPSSLACIETKKGKPDPQDMSKSGIIRKQIEEYILPASLRDSWSLARLHVISNEIRKHPNFKKSEDESDHGPTFVLAIMDSDSSIVYYRVAQGIPNAVDGAFDTKGTIPPKPPVS